LSTHRSIFFLERFSGIADGSAGGYEGGAAAMLESLIFILGLGGVLSKHFVKPCCPRGVQEEAAAAAN
jgi:hypothetical protein